MKTKYILFVLVMILIFRCKAEAQNYAQLIIRSVGLISFTYSDSITTGTGTILYVPTDSLDHGRAYLLTCYHVLPKYSQNRVISFQIERPFKDSSSYVTMKIPVYDKFGIYFREVKVDTLNDLAIIDITDIFLSDTIYNYLKDFILPYSLLATDEIIKKNQITIGDEISFIGYPDFFYDKRNYSPIVRTGIISSDPVKQYYFNNILRRFYSVGEKLNGFLIDANVFHGSSGSVVYVNNSFFKSSKPGRIEVKTSETVPYILGIINVSFPDLHSKDLSQNLNLGQVISSRTILALLLKFGKPYVPSPKAAKNKIH